MQNKAEQDRNQDATVYLGNLDERASDAMVWELMLQAGPVSNVFLPKDRISGVHQGFGFCEFMAEQDADYAVKIMNQIKLFGKPIRVNKASYDAKKPIDIGANLFVGSLDESVEEGQLHETFSTFGSLAEAPKISRDPTTGASKGFGFVSYHDFEAADAAIENMNGQFLGGKQITVQFAFKKDGKGERHGTQAERLLAAQAKKNSLLPGSGGPAPSQFQGAFAGALAGQQQPGGYPAQPPPPPPGGIPVYQPPPQHQQPSYPPPPPTGFQPPLQQNGYPGYPPPPVGFPVANGAGAPPPPGMGMGMYGGYPQQQQHQGGPPPPPPIRMGFDGTGQ